MAQTLSELLVRLGVDAGALYQELDKSQRRSKTWADNWTAIGRDMGKAVAGYSLIFGAMVKSQINALDELDEAAQKTGDSVEALSRLNYAAGLEGVEDFTGTMVRLNRSMVQGKDAASQEAQAFKALGVSATDAEGRMRPTGDVLMDVAQAFAASEDGATKSAIAMALFGKSGADLIPFLNNGREGLARLTDEADRFGVTVSGEAAAAAGQFNDNMYRLGAVIRGAANNIAEGLAPTLANLTTQFADNTTNSEGFALAVRQVDEGLKLVIASGAVLTGVFQVVGKLLGGTAAAMGALTKDMKWYHLAPPLAIYKAFENSSAAAEGFTAAIEDSAETAAGVKAFLDRLYAQTAITSGQTEEDVTESAKNILSFGGDAGRREAEKLAAQAIEQAKKNAAELAQVEVDQRKLMDELASEDLRARNAYVQKRADIERLFVDDVLKRNELLLSAETAYNQALAKVQADRDKAEQDAALKKQQAADVTRRNQDRDLQNDPWAVLAGIKSVEDLNRAMNPLQNSLMGMAEVANSAFSTMGRSAADVGTELLLTGDAGEDAGKRIAQALVRDVVGGLLQVGMQMIAQRVLASTLNTTGTGEVVAQQGVIAAAAAPAAAAVSLSTAGLNSVPAMAAIAATAAAAGALLFAGNRELGGGAYPGMAYNVNEQDRPELYKRRSDGRIFLMPGQSGGDVLRMDEAQAGGGGFGGGRGVPNVQIINNGDPIAVRSMSWDGEQIQMVIDSAASMAEARIAGGISNGRSPVAGAITRRFGVQGRAT